MLAPYPGHNPALQTFLARCTRVIDSLSRIEAVGGLLLLLAAAVALVWANSPFRASYDALWHLPIGLNLGSLSFETSLHFIINDVLMVIFFLAVGLEVRREMHEGCLARPRDALLPIVGAIGGVVAPAAIYLALIPDSSWRGGWAIPVATDIAFALGVLALLGRGIPSSVRIFLMTLAIIDDVMAVLIIAIFYTEQLQPLGLVAAFGGVGLVLLMNRAGIGAAIAYVVPGFLIWGGLLYCGAHPTLAGVILGIMTPVAVFNHTSSLPAEQLRRQLEDCEDDHSRYHFLRMLQRGHRESLPPASRVQIALHPWVVLAIMPLFALANAGVPFVGAGETVAEAGLMAVAMALVLGKPLGIFLVVWVCIRTGLSKLPEGASWTSLLVVSHLAGIGFTMSIFITQLSFTSPLALNSAKLGVLVGSALSMCLALVLGFTWLQIQKRWDKAEG